MGTFVDVQEELRLNIALLVKFTEARKKAWKVVFNELDKGTIGAFDN